MKYLIFLLVLSGCSGLTADQFYYRNLYSQYCYYEKPSGQLSEEDTNTFNYYQSMCQYSKEIK